MIFHHYSDRHVTALTDDYYSPADREIMSLRRDKPLGFWFTTAGEDNWLQWCNDNEWGSTRLTHRTLVEVDPARLLFLTSVEDIHEFSSNFGRPHPNLTNFRNSRDHIDWHHVAARWAGIVIDPYQWSCRLDLFTHWYYTWDCASGCIWDLTAIRSLEPDLCYTFSPPSSHSTAECSFKE